MKNHHLCSLLDFFRLKKKSPQLDQVLQLPEGLCRQFSLAELRAATNNFNRDCIIGRGSFGAVLYKGTIDDGTTVAVKRYDIRRDHAVLKEYFRTEAQFLCQLRHPHLVSLIGLCLTENEMFIVLEYMSRGSLADFLFGIGEVNVPLAWKRRLQICIGAARGLHYLHTGAKHGVIHRDIKTANIVLDEEWCCKLSDFGLCKLGPPSMSKALKRMDTRLAGTMGYIAPEYAHGELTEKADVFSFGIILFDVLYGRKVFDSTLPEQNWSLLDWAQESLREGRIYDAIDPNLKGRIGPECLNKYLEIASSCVHKSGEERPGMGEVEVTLELALELQERSDSEMKAINPSSECMYEEALFSSFVRNFSGLDSLNIYQNLLMTYQIMTAFIPIIACLMTYQSDSINCNNTVPECFVS